VRVPNRYAFWLVLSAVACTAASTLLWGLGRWPWDVDEVATSMELRLYNTDHPEILRPGTQLYRLPRLIPIWYWCQSQVLRVLPVNEWNARILPASFGMLACLAAFAITARRHGLAYGACLALVMNVNPQFLALSQQNRFYTMAVLLQILTVWSIFISRDNRVALAALTLSLSLLAVLCHNLLLVFFVLVAIATGMGYWKGRVSWGAVTRSALAAGVGVTLYFAHVRPLASHWNETQPPRSIFQVLTGFVAEAGLPTLALALIGAAARPTRSRDVEFRWWTLLAALCASFIVVGPLVIWFNHRYTLLFLLPFWVLAARGILSVGRRLGPGLHAWSWYVFVSILLLPKAVSYYQDGSRHDFRAAAECIARMAREDDPIYCNWRELGYYRPGVEIANWNPKTVFPAQVCYLVQGGNALDPPIKVPGRVVELVAMFGHRRFDEQSNVVRVFRIWPPRTGENESR
jgi:hypothetical protein